MLTYPKLSKTIKLLFKAVLKLQEGFLGNWISKLIFIEELISEEYLAMEDAIGKYLQ